MALIVEVSFSSSRALSSAKLRSGRIIATVDGIVHTLAGLQDETISF